MTNVIFQRKEFEKQLGEKLSEKIIEKISLFGTPLERTDETEIEIEIFPNRPDLISIHGYMRAFKSFLGKASGLKDYKLNNPEKDYTIKVDKEVKDIRPYTVCAIVKNLSLGNNEIKSIMDLQEKLHITVGRNRKKVAIGIYPLEKIKLPITYTAKKPSEIKFIPLGLEKELNAMQILKIHPAGKKYKELLKGCQKYPVFVDSENKILSMPPIINSREAGKIEEKTKEVFVECSGSDLNTIKKTLNILVTTLADMGGKIYQMNIQYEKKIVTPDLTPEKMPISLKNTNKLLGLSLGQKDISRLLEKMGHDYKNQAAVIPAWRTDILHEVDLIEDIAIAYGYENFKPEIPSISTIAQESRESRIKNSIAEILTGLGLIETSSYHLIKSEELKVIKVQKPIELENSKTEYKILRPNLLIPALRILGENIDTEYPQKIFEIGTIFGQDEKEETGIKETENLIIAATPANFTEAKQILDYLFSSLGLAYKLKESIEEGFIDGRTGHILLGNKPIGHIGEMHPVTLNKAGLKMPLAVIEITLDDIYAFLKRE